MIIVLRMLYIIIWVGEIYSRMDATEEQSHGRIAAIIFVLNGANSLSYR